MGRLIAPVRAWFDERVAPTTAWGAVARFLEHQMTDRAATLSYYAMLSLFPALLVTLAVIGLTAGEGTVEAIVSFASEQGVAGGDLDVVETVARRVSELSGGAVSLTLLVSLVIGLNAASGIFNAAGRAVDAAFEVRDERGFVHQRLTVYAVTGVVLLLLLVVFLMVVIGGDIARGLFDLVGLGSEVATVWNLARWPAALALAIVAVAVVMRFAPSPEARRSHVVSRGTFATVGGWILASVGFSVYVANFSHYGALYGAFSTAIVLLLWLYLLAIAFLFGAELDAEVAHRRDGGAPAQAG